ncbi:AAA family ATPase [Polaromonas aquatica]|uniref:AAA family ATPase n=1 Tax=Polaromonas aquatica TaxID=332657 RepID=A0ABW1TWA3_9BURK
MKARSQYLSRLLKTVGFWLFGVLPSAAAILSAVIMFSTWMGDKNPPLSFHIFGRFTTEARVLLSLIAYLVLLHLARIWMCKRLTDANGTIPFEPELTSDSLRAFLPAVMTSYIVFFALWGAFGTKVAATNYVLLAAFGLITFLSWVIIKTGWLYGFVIADRSRVQYGDSSEPAQHANVARKQVAKITFKDIHGNTAIKRRLLEAGRAIVDAPKGGLGKARNGILMDGGPGNGKTVLAEALAGELKLPLLTLTHSDVASRWVGERTEKVKAAFEQAIRTQPCVFFIDEIDSFLPDRSTDSAQTKEDSDVTNSLLTLLIEIRKHRVVVVAATNYVDRLDSAAIREGRFDFKIEITPPDEEARIGLLTAGLKTNAPTLRVNLATIKTVAQRWNGFSVKRILAVTEEVPSYVAEAREQGAFKGELEFDDFMAALRRLQGRKGSTPENVKAMADLVLPEVTREAMTMLASRLKDPQRIERLGGTLPSGVLFFGPPGTGKTVACKALAKEVEWAFLTKTGPDLVRDPKALDKLYAQAKDLRPCIIFVDEADDLLISREASRNSEATNKLLTIMDGVNDRVRDVVWVAATNNPEQIDTALLRGGRFTEKVEFVRPDENQLTTHIAQWFTSRKIGLKSGLDAPTIASMLGDESIANAEAVLQYAVNRAISKTNDDFIEVGTADVQRGVTMVLGASC